MAVFPAGRREARPSKSTTCGSTPRQSTISSFFAPVAAKRKAEELHTHTQDSLPPQKQTSSVFFRANVASNNDIPNDDNVNVNVARAAERSTEHVTHQSATQDSTLVAQRTRIRQMLAVDNNTANIDDAGNANVTHDSLRTPPHVPNTASTVARKYTPLETQFLQFKQQHPDCMFMIEVGYKFRFFGQDAKVAAKELNIVAFLDHSMYTASVPTHRLMIYVRKLAILGYKIAVVRQRETAAIKACGDNKSTLFLREIDHIYTRGTLIDDVSGGNNGDDDTGSASSESDGNFILCIRNNGNSNNNTPQSKHKLSLSVMAVDVLTGEVLYDNFIDNAASTELETRLAHIPFVEVLLSWNGGKQSELNREQESPVETARTFIASGSLENAIALYCERHKGAYNSVVRIERKPELFMQDETQAKRNVIEYYERNAKSIPHRENTIDEVEIVKQAKTELEMLSPETIICLDALIKHLSHYKLDSIMLPSNFKTFTSRSCMLLNADTLHSLEVFQNQTTGNHNNTLFTFLNRTKTKFGARMLRKWVAFPLTDISAIQDRQIAISEILSGFVVKGIPLKDTFSDILAEMPDLEKSLVKVMYNRCGKFELYRLIVAMSKIANLCERLDISETPLGEESLPKSRLLVNALNMFKSLKDNLKPFEGKIEAKAAKSNSVVGIFNDESEYPYIGEAREGIDASEKHLNLILSGYQVEYERSPLGGYFDSFKCVSGEECLLEFPVRLTSLVPSSWIKVSSTKSVSRFRSPEIVAALRKLQYNRDMLLTASEMAFKAFQTKFATKFNYFYNVARSIAEIDCIYSLSAISRKSGYVFPTFHQANDSFLSLSNSRNPVIEDILGDNRYVPNDVSLSNETGRSLLITGPNMGGKSSYVRQIAISVVLAQIGCSLPAERADLTVFDSIFTRMGTSDDIARGQSTFMRELCETSRVMSLATDRSLVILDELGRGTSTHDGTAIAYASLRYFASDIRSITLFITHYPVLGELAADLAFEYPNVKLLRNCHMSVMKNVADECGSDMVSTNTDSRSNGSTSDVVFLYKIVDGLSSQSFGLNVARMARLSSSVIERAGETAGILKLIMESRYINGCIAKLNKAKSLLE